MSDRKCYPVYLISSHLSIKFVTNSSLKKSCSRPCSCDGPSREFLLQRRVQGGRTAELPRRRHHLQIPPTHGCVRNRDRVHRGQRAHRPAHQCSGTVAEVLSPPPSAHWVILPRWQAPRLIESAGRSSGICDAD